ncbi:MAG: methylmalonyl Co-A mutase-associated GTPase MeaB [Planctomycetota bacterium]
MTDSLKQLAVAVASNSADKTRAAAKLISRIADRPETVPQLLAYLHDAPQPRLTLGITGAPGVGKSTLTDAIITEFRRRYPDRLLGIIAVDPSSPTTGGAILGDRIRMMRHASDPNVFIRSLASRGRLGGLTGGIMGTIRVLGALRSDIVIVETVGVGQTEVDVQNIADLVAVVLAPGFGDDIQLLKAGLLEIGDLFIINKADRPGAQELQAALESTMTLNAEINGTKRDDKPTVFLTTATDGVGLVDVVDALERQAEVRRNQWHQRRSERSMDAIRRALIDSAQRRFMGALETNGTITEHLHRVLRGERSIDAVVQELLNHVASSLPKT